MAHPYQMNVYDLSQERIKLLFEEFDNIVVSFSGGKDSGVMLNLIIDYMRRHGITRRIGVMHIDYEAQYQMSTDYVERTLTQNLDILDVHWICLPLRAHCATSMYQSYWTPWEKSQQEIWVRKLPQNCIHEDNHPYDFLRPGITDYEFQDKFATWYHRHRQATRTACLVGIRTQESLNRWRAIHSDRNYRNYNGLNWTKQMSDDVFNAYPIYDWLTEDIWTANGKFRWDYNHLYDLFYQAGVPLDKMRVASPFNDWATESLKLYRVIDPDNWGRMVGRVNGVNFTGIYGGTTAMGWQSIKLPAGHTWESYMHFLLKTLPPDARANYLTKLSTSIKFWREKGGVLSNETIEQLKAAGIKVETSKKENYKTDKLAVRLDYLDDFESEEFSLLPTYKRVCICILKNDHLCKYMGFSLNKSEMTRRKNIMEKYQNLL